MTSFLPTLRGLTTRLARPFLPSSAASTVTMAQSASFTTTPTPQKKVKNRGNLDKATMETLSKISNIKTALYAHAPPTLRMARNRWLRHWTIHRAWQLHQRAKRTARHNELMRMQQGMSLACEELRKTVGPAGKGEGHLFRVAMIKENVWNTGSVPIEYARFQTETPGRTPWEA